MANQQDHEFKVGDKVVPLSKSVADPIEKSVVWRRAKGNHQPFLYIKEIQPSKLILTDKMTLAGDYYLASDIIPYKEPSAPAPRLKVGDRVKIPYNRRNADGSRSLEDTSAFIWATQKGVPFFTITHIEKDEALVSGKDTTSKQSTFKLTDLEPYEEKTTNMTTSVITKNSKLVFKGKLHHLRAFEQDIKELGFTFPVIHVDLLGRQTSSENSNIFLFIGDATEKLGASNTSFSPNNYTFFGLPFTEPCSEFNLPQDYNAAIKAVQEWLEINKSPKSFNVWIGNPSLEVVVTKDVVKHKGFEFKKENVQEILQRFRTPAVAGLTVRPETLHIGCAEGTNVKKEDVEQLLKMMNDL